ncbi:MAG: SBBP repeat-containing protein [Chitinophagales bacterium]|nr:SBBP repeat-containing protein [Chitinophagales bacterium]
MKPILSFRPLVFILCTFLSLNGFAQQLQWAQYAGGINSDYIEEIAVDHHGNIIISGATNSKGIATNGAYQSVKSLGNDFFISKYRSNGTLVWCTYYGGNDSDYPFTMTLDKDDNIYIGGETKSTDVSSTNAYQTTIAGNFDALLVKFDSSGNRMWATYFGGDGKEQLLCCATDDLGNIFIGGLTISSINISTPGSFQPIYGGGEGDAFLAKFNSAGAIQWATYYGGTLDDRFHGMDIDDAGNVIVSGTTSSKNGISSPGAFQVNHGGANDAFLVKFANSGSRIWGTYYGKNGTERGRECCVDNSNTFTLQGLLPAIL